VSSVEPVLAVDRARHVGEPIAIGVVPTRAEAEAAKIEIDFAPLP